MAYISLKTSSVKYCALAMFGLIVCKGAVGAPQQHLTAQEAGVIAAVVKSQLLQKDMRWIALPTHTVSFDCRSAATDVIAFSLSGCSGMRSKGQSIMATMRLIKEHMPDLPSSLIRRFVSRGGEEAIISKRLPIQVRQVIVSHQEKVDWKNLGSPEFALYPSRVSFNSDKDKALVYLGVMSWDSRIKSRGEYVYLIRKGNVWLIHDHVDYWQM